MFMVMGWDNLVSGVDSLVCGLFRELLCNSGFSGVTDDRNHMCTYSAKVKPEGSDEVRNCCCKSREHNAETSHV